jgi:hypothetical protein
MEEGGWNNSSLARKLAGRLATPKQVANERRQIVAWKNGRRMKKATAQRVAKALRIPWQELYQERPSHDLLSRLAALEELAGRNAENVALLAQRVRLLEERPSSRRPAQEQP